MQVELPADVINNNIQKNNVLWEGTLGIKRKHTHLSIAITSSSYLKKNRNDIHLIFCNEFHVGACERPQRAKVLVITTGTLSLNPRSHRVEGDLTLTICSLTFIHTLWHIDMKMKYKNK